MARSKSTGRKEAPNKHTSTSRVKKPPRRGPGRANPLQRYISVQHCVAQLDGENRKRFEKTCFGHFTHFPKFILFPHLVHNILLKRKDKEEEDAMSFVIGSQEICFGEREFAMMSGLKFQMTDEIVQKPREEIRLMKVYFPSQKCVKLEDLIRKFHELKNSEDKLKLGLVAIVENAITGHDMRRSVNKGHFLLVDNLEEFNSYPWGKQRKLAYHLNGFPHVFQAWIFESIPSLKQKYTVKNKNCPQALHPRILHMEMPQPKAPSHEQICADLSCVIVLSTLHLTQEEVKESYMAGLLSEVDVSGVRGHEKDSGAEELRYEDNSTEQWEANHCSSPTNPLRTLPNDEDQYVGSVENLKLKLRSEIELLNKEKPAVESDVGSLTKTRKELETDRCKLTEEKTVLNKEKLKLGRDIESLYKKKTKLGTDTDLLNKEKEKLHIDFDILNKQHTVLQCDIGVLYKEKAKLQNDCELLKKEKSTVQGDVCSLIEKKTSLESEIGSLSNVRANIGNETEFLNKKKTKLQSDFELLKKEKSTVQDDICSLDEKKITIQVDIRWLNEKKTTFERKIESLNYEKTNLRNDNQLLDKEKTILQTETEFFNKGKMELRSDFEFLDQEKAKLGKDVVLLKKRKCEMETNFELLKDEKIKLHTDIESLNKEKAKLENDFELTNKEKDKLQNDIESLNKEKDKLQYDIEYHNEEKAEFIRSVTADLNKSFYEREKTLAENEKMFKEKNQTLVANTQELQEARQDLIKVHYLAHFVFFISEI
ncbi:hypothetical protein MKX03_012797 [Papaver bracteatum]|nr:hypothetical protein MKX03_012797 [Papaver bracteatum]